MAHKSADRHGFRRGTVIYFAVDFDATAEEIISNIVPYFHGVQSRLAALGRRYVAGVYESRNVCARVSREAFTAWSFVSGMSYRFSGNLGYPLPENWALNQIKEFRFQAGDDSFALDNDVHQPGADAGADAVGSNVEPLKDYLDYIDRVYRAAQNYPGGGDPSVLVLAYLRYPHYATIAWVELAGPHFVDWIAHADKQVGPRVTQYRDPSLGAIIDVDHFGATASGVLWNARGTPRPARGDFSGWLGDLASFYGEWRAASVSYPSGYAFCQARLARPDVDSTFSFNDLIEDVDGHLIALRTRAGTPVNTAIREHLAEGGPHVTRFTRFVKERYGTSPDGIVNAARKMLTNGSDTFVTTLRTGVIFSSAGGTVLLPSALPADKLAAFLHGYAEKLQALAQAEPN
ncbi:glycoside hydrolase domain-containing protein [Actinomadura sediminis]|uniref:Glycoside hydrolase domain-containing protein n=1 Tax=Actinomadura sediminis TaxID=1038904 RepID=A0ABW3EWY3_9ACTN